MSLPHQAGVGGEKAGRPDPLAGWARGEGRTLKTLPDDLLPRRLAPPAGPGRPVVRPPPSERVPVRRRGASGPDQRSTPLRLVKAAGITQTCQVMTLYVRDIRPSDRTRLTRLWEACAPDLAATRAEQDIELALNDRHRTLLVGHVGSLLVASVMAGLHGDHGWARYLAVDPAHRLRGHGREIMEEAGLWLAARGAPTIDLIVEDGADIAEAFCRQIGFERRAANVYGKWRMQEIRAS